MKQRLGLVIIAALLVGCGPVLKLGGDSRKSVLRGPVPWDRDSKAFPIRSAPTRIGFLDCPSLYVLADQVLPERSVGLLADREEVFRDGYGSPALQREAARAALVAKYMPDPREARGPIPDDVASLPFTRVFVETMVAAYLREPGPRRTLRPSDVRAFAESMSAAHFSPYRGDSAPTHLKRLRMFTDQRKVTWEGVARAYFRAYFLGKFIDRTGGLLSRPTIGLKVTNETITGALSVALESLSDYTILACEKFKDPVIYDPGEVWQTAQNLRPTLVTVTQHLQGLGDGDPVKEYLRVVEPVKDPGPGISKAKLDEIRAASGYAGDLAGAVSDLIVRTIGGGGVSAVAFGKVSIGDNDTLSKLVQTGMNWLFGRTTEIFVATQLYDAKPGPTRLAEPKSIFDVLQLEP